MTGPDHPSQERLSSLDARIRELETISAKPDRPAKKTPPPKPQLSAKTRMARRILLAVNLGWGAFVFGLMVLMSDGLTPFEWVFVPLFIIVCALGTYGFQLFYWEMAQWFWRKAVKGKQGAS